MSKSTQDLNLQLELHLVNDMLDSIVETLNDMQEKGSKVKDKNDPDKYFWTQHPPVSHHEKGWQPLPQYPYSFNRVTKSATKIVNIDDIGIKMIRCNLCKKFVNSDSALDHYTRVHSRHRQANKNKIQRNHKYVFHPRTLNIHHGAQVPRSSKLDKTSNSLKNQDQVQVENILSRPATDPSIPQNRALQNEARPNNFLQGSSNSVAAVKICSFCGLWLKTQSELYQHITHRHAQYKYLLHTCYICETFFKTQRCLRNHLQEQHRKESYCVECRQCFDTEHDYYIHLAKAGYCQICNHRILNKCLAIQHTQTHVASYKG